jgi:hypothetical protein
MHNIYSFSLQIPLRLECRGVAICNLHLEYQIHLLLHHTNLTIPSEALATVVMMKVTKWIKLDSLTKNEQKRMWHCTYKYLWRSIKNEVFLYPRALYNVCSSPEQIITVRSVINEQKLKSSQSKQRTFICSPTWGEKNKLWQQLTP